VSLQVAAGIAATRISQILGQKSGDYVSIIDPSRLIGGWKPVEAEVPLGAISQLFERLTNMVGTDEKVADDIIDIAWFVIITWSVISTALVVSIESFRILCPIGAFVVGVSSVFCYVNGYQIGSKKNFDEDLEHLGYYIKTRLSEIFKHFEGSSLIVKLRLLVAGKKMVLSDVGVKLGSPEEPTSSVIYWIGLSSDRNESIEIRNPNDKEIETGLKELPPLSTLNWNVDEIPAGFSIRNTSDFISLHDPSTYLARTSAVAEGIDAIVASMTSISALLKTPQTDTSN
jgi:hypothetical protein